MSCICEDVDGMARYSVECPNSFHAQRARAHAMKAALKTILETRPGAERSAYGQCYGQRGRLTHMGDKVQCHLCGRGFHNLGKHAQATHGIPADDYRREFMLHYSLGLVSNAYARRMSRRPQNGLLRHTKNHPRKAQMLTEFVCRYCGGPIVTRISSRVPQPVHCRQCKGEHSKRTAELHLMSPEVRVRAAQTLAAKLAANPRERRNGRWV